MSNVLGVLFAVLLGIIAIRPYISYEHQGIVNTEVAATAGQERLISSAAQAYIQQNYAAVEAAATPSTPAIITVAMLENTGFLPASLAATNPYGQTWQVQVLQPTTGNLQALVLSTGGNSIPQSQAPAIAAQTGQEGGFIPYAGQYGSGSSSTAIGAYGGWSVSMTGYSNPGAGHLAALVAFNNGNLQNDYLYRVAVPGQPQLNTMSTNLDMGNNQINDASNVSVDGGAAGIGTAGSSGSCNSNSRLNLSGSQIWDSCDGNLNMEPGGGNSSVIATQANIQASGKIGAYGEPATSGYPTGWAGGIHTWDLYAGGSVGAGENGSLLADMSGQDGAGGEVTVASENNQFSGGLWTNSDSAADQISNSAGSYASMSVPDSGNNNARIATNGAIEVANASGATQFSANNIGEVTASNDIQPGAVATADYSCPKNGALAASTTGSGELLDCVNGEWTYVGNNFEQAFQVTLANGAVYQNNTGKPISVSTDCESPTSDIPATGLTGIFFALFSPTGAEVAGSDELLRINSSASSYTPHVAEIVPNGYSWQVSWENPGNMACTAGITE